MVDFACVTAPLDWDGVYARWVTGFWPDSQAFGGGRLYLMKSN